MGDNGDGKKASSDIWTAPKMWPGATCYVIGGGPSIGDLTEEDWGVIKKKRTIATNNSYLLAPWAEALFFMDWKWFEQHENRLKRYHGLKITIAAQGRGKKGILFCERGSRNLLGPYSWVINHGNNSGYCGINLAVHFGAKRIILVGFDMALRDKKHNYHDEHERMMKDNVYREEFLPCFDSLPDGLKERGVEVLNATPESALKTFPFVSLRDTESL